MSESDIKAVPLWDLFTRIFHWTLVLAIPAAWISAETGNFEAHEWLGYTMLVLVTTRILWGFAGSRHSRFADFLVGPGKVLAYLRSSEWTNPGHNPLGGVGVVLMLLLLLLQAFSGLFNTDDSLFSGPLYRVASTSFRDTMGVVHEVAFNLLLGLVALHILAVLIHQFKHGKPLIQAMWRGSARGRHGLTGPVPQWRAALIIIILALLLWWGLSQVPPPQIMW
jgi:cytochrome b